MDIPLPEGGTPPPLPPSLCHALVGEEEEQKVKDWCRENGHDRGDYFEERLAKADELRLEANILFKDSKLDAAVTRYLGAIWHLDYDVTQQMELQQPEQEEIDTRKLKAISNTCAAFLKLAQTAEMLEQSAPEEQAECFARWEENADGEGMKVEDPVADERAALAQARLTDPDIIDYSQFEAPLKPKVPVSRKRMLHRERKKEYYRLVKTTADIGLKQISRMCMDDKDIQAKFNYRLGIAEFERGFSEPAYEAFKKANELTPGDRDIRQALAKAKDAVQGDRAEAKEVWRGKLGTKEEDNTGLLGWLDPRQLVGCVRRRVGPAAPRQRQK